MKKKIIILIVNLLILIAPIFAQNITLWNGIHTGMTEEQATQRLRAIAGNDTIRIWRDTAVSSVSSTTPMVLLNTSVRELNYSFSQGLVKIRAFIQSPSYTRLEYIGNINLTFFNGRIITVAVSWSASAITRNQMLIQQFGQPKFNSANKQLPAWESSGMFVVTNDAAVFTEIIFIDINGFRNAVNDDTRKKQQSSGIQF